MIRRCKAKVLSVLGTIFYRAGRRLTFSHYFTFGSWVLSVSIYFNGRATTEFGLLTAQMMERSNRIA